MNVELTTLEARAAVHAALADVTRLRIVDLLTVGDLAVSDLATRLAIPSNLLAHHLRTLEAAGVVIRRGSEGDRRRTYVTLVRSVRGTHGVAVPGPNAPETGPLPGLAGSPGPVSRVVFVCTANTARSHLAAALWRRASRVGATSAGTDPGERINPTAVAVAEGHGLRFSAKTPRSFERVYRDTDLVVTVCDRAHEELADHGWVHWSVPDPVAVGSRSAFEEALEDLSDRVETLAPLVARAS